MKDFKDHIASAVAVEANSQRLIFCGKVLQDEKKLTEYEVNGKTIHLVQKAPHSSHSGPSSSNASDQNSTAGGGNNRRRHPAGFRGPSFGQQGQADASENSYLLGAFTVPQDSFDATNFSQIVQDVIANLGDIGRNATVQSRTSEDGSAVDVHINLGQLPVANQDNEAQARVLQINRLLRFINRGLDELERGEGTPPSQSSSGEISPTDQQQPIGAQPTNAAETAASNIVNAGNAAEAAAQVANFAAQLAQQAAAVTAAQFNQGPPAPGQVIYQHRMPIRVEVGIPPGGGPSAAQVYGPFVSLGQGGIQIPLQMPTIPQPQRPQAPPRAASRPAASRGTGPGQQPAASSEQPQASGPRIEPFTQRDFGELLKKVSDTEARYRTHVSQLQAVLLQEDGPEAEGTDQSTNVRLHRFVSRVMHHFGHIYHLMRLVFDFVEIICN